MSLELGKLFQLKPGVSLAGLDTRFELHISRWSSVADFIREVCGACPTITSAHDGVHSVNSLHAKGMALDLRIRDWKIPAEVAARVIAWILGEPWVVILEKDHIHIQLSTNNIKNPGAIEEIGGGGYLRQA